MSVRIGCAICGESSPETIEFGPAVEWSMDHRCAVPKLIELASGRAGVIRLGMSTARETDRDLVIMGEMAKRLAAFEAEAFGRVQRFADSTAAQFDSELDYDGAEIKRRILMDAHNLDPQHVGAGERCLVCDDDLKLDG